MEADRDPALRPLRARTAVGHGAACRARPLLRQTELHLRPPTASPFTGVAALLYRTGEDFQGLHSDRELRWLDDTRIAIVVLGQRRPFVFRRRVPFAEVVERIPAGADPDDIVLTPGEGDMFVMGGASQRDWLHGVPAGRHGQPAISLTWRWTSRRGRPDTNPTFYDGRQYSDGPAAGFPHNRVAEACAAPSRGSASAPS